MRHQFTDDQIIHARHAAARHMSRVQILRFDVKDIRALLNALPEPEPQDDWQQCSWGDILHTDERVKAEYISGTIIEGVPDGISDDAVFLVDSHVIRYSTDARWYRIPAPVQHPDPEEHPVILVHEAYGESMVPPIGMIWDASEHYESPSHRIEPDQITGFTPAKVVADDD